MYTFTSRVRFSETDENGKLSLAGIMNYLQDCSVFHSEDVGNGTDMLKKRDRVWLLNSWQIIIKERPRCCEYIEIGTQAYQFKGTLGKRNFCIQRQVCCSKLKLGVSSKIADASGAHHGGGQQPLRAWNTT